MLRFGFPCLLDQLRWEAERLHTRALLHPHCPGSSPPPSSFLSNVLAYLHEKFIYQSFFPFWLCSISHPFSCSSLPGVSGSSIWSGGAASEMIIPCSGSAGSSGSFPQCMFFLLGSGMSAISSDIYVRFMTWSQKRHFWVGCFPAEWFWPWSSPELFISSPRNIAGWLYLCERTIARLHEIPQREAVCRDSRKLSIWGQYFLESLLRSEKPHQYPAARGFWPCLPFSQWLPPLWVMISVFRNALK